MTGFPPSNVPPAVRMAAVNPALRAFSQIPIRSDRHSDHSVVLLGIAAGWSYFLSARDRAFGPTSEINNISNIDFNSDSAIPVLMANDRRPITIFNFYYYCADRWGGWPFLPMQIAERIAGYRWTADSIFAVQAAWLFVGPWPLPG